MNNEILAKMRDWRAYLNDKSRHLGELRKCKNIDELLSHNSVNHLATQCKLDWPETNRVESIAAMAGLLAYAGPDDSEQDTNGFVGKWALTSWDKQPDGMHINESRFLKWIDARSWDDFLKHGIVGVGIVQSEFGCVSWDDIIYQCWSRAYFEDCKTKELPVEWPVNQAFNNKTINIDTGSELISKKLAVAMPHSNDKRPVSANSYKFRAAAIFYTCQPAAKAE